jgi:hypothetical protein
VGAQEVSLTCLWRNRTFLSCLVYFVNQLNFFLQTTVYSTLWTLSTQSLSNAPRSPAKIQYHHLLSKARESAELDEGVDTIDVGEEHSQRDVLSSKTTMSRCQQLITDMLISQSCPNWPKLFDLQPACNPLSDPKPSISSPIPISEPIVIIVAPAEYLLYTYYTYIKLFSMFILLYIYQDLF